jgi:uncharacterized protein YidB (DUF937 family)
MSLLTNILGAVTGNSPAAGNPIMGAIGGLLGNGGLQGLMAKFTQGGLGDIFSSWIGMGENKAISPEQVQQALGADQIQDIASKMGVDPAQASGFLSEHLPKIVDKLSPSGEIDDTADHSAGLSAMLPSLLAKLGIGG